MYFCKYIYIYTFPIFFLKISGTVGLFAGELIGILVTSVFI